MSNMSVNKPVAVPATGKKSSFATADKTPIQKVGISVLRRTLSVVPKADIGVVGAGDLALEHCKHPNMD